MGGVGMRRHIGSNWPASPPADQTTPVGSKKRAIARCRSWLRVYGIKTLNVAGKREGVAEGMPAAVPAFLVAALTADPAAELPGP